MMCNLTKQIEDVQLAKKRIQRKKHLSNQAKNEEVYNGHSVVAGQSAFCRSHEHK